MLLRDYQPINRWEHYYHQGIGHHYYKDHSTGNSYVAYEPSVMRLHSMYLVGATAAQHVGRIANNFFNMTTLYQFAREIQIDSFQEGLATMGRDLIGIIATVVALPFLEIAALYGILSPCNGQKLYASIERLLCKSYNLEMFHDDLQPHPTPGIDEVRSLSPSDFDQFMEYGKTKDFVLEKGI